MTDSKKAKLYLIPNVLAPSTQSDVMAESVRNAIKQCDIFLVEDLRTARRYISAMQLGLVIEDLKFEILNKKTPDTEMGGLMYPLTKGMNVGVISEAGCPGIADPGARAVQWAHRHQFEVVPLVGPSSILMALISSGFNGQQFTFHGYLPITPDQLVKKLKILEKEVKNSGGTQIFMETPYRNNKLMKTMLEQFASKTLLCVASQISAPDQYIYTAPVSWWKTNIPDLHKKPTVFLIGQ